MSHQVLSRKYRPQRFADLVGQEHVARILQNALASGRVGHAYLLVGPRGVGKTTTARIFARALNCSARTAQDETAPAAAPTQGVFEPCGTCASCRDIAHGADLDVVEMDAASNNAVDDVRALREQVGYATVRSRYRIWIVDEVHMLSLPAFNAFLKTLEEPPAQVKFLFCTTEEHKLPDTFRSRCQRVEFRPIDAAAMARRLEELAKQEDVPLGEGLAEAIAHGALGGLRDAESQLEQLIAARADGGPITCADLDALSGRAPGDLLDALCAAVDARDAATALDAVDACLAAGSKPGVLVDQWLERLREQLVAAVREPADAAAARTGYARVARGIDVLLGKRAHLRAGADGGLVVQVAAVELARLPDARDLDALIAALRGAPAEPGSAPPPEPGAAEPRPPARFAPAATPPEAPAQPVARRPSTAARPKRAHAAGSPGVSAPPAARPAAPNDGDSVGGGVGVEQVRTAWPDIVRRALRRSPPLGRALQASAPRDLHDDLLGVVITKTGSTARGTLLRREAQLAFGQIARESLGVYLRLEVREERRPIVALEPVGEDMRGHPAVQLVTEATGGRLLNIERRAAVPAPPEHPTGAG